MKKKFRQALKDTFPIFVSYFALSFSFGIICVKSGINAYIAILMSLLIYSGSLQFLIIAIYKKLSLIDIFITSFLFNFRQFFYSLTFLDRYKNQFYKVFALTDETFAILSHKDHDNEYELYVSALNHFYWVFGTICGIVFVNYINFKLKGLNFILICLFVVLLLDNILYKRKIFPFFIGIFCYFLCYMIRIPNILISSILLSFIIIMLRYKYD